METLRSVYNKYTGIKLGIAGSYVNGTNDENSDIDVVLEGDSTRIEVAEYIKSLFTVTTDVLWVDLMKEEDLALDGLARSVGIPENKNSVYKTVMREVIWI